ncbi:MAG TPA: glycosyltransferase family 4 protein [Miltoncostaeaceae bacterium]|nr:glycosyltransferase family 4 protein [Miltoncostaeaceae bacterium]
MATEYAYPVLGGIPEHVHNLSKELAARGHDVTVLTSKAPLGMKGRGRAVDAENLSLHGYRTVRIPISMPIVSNGSVARISVGLQAKHAIARALEGMDVVHGQGLAVPTIVLWSLRVSPAPVNVGTFHTYFDGGHWGYKYFFAYVRSTMARTDRVIAVSDACVTALRPYFPDLDFNVIPNGVDTTLYRPLGPGEERPPGPPRILFVGRFDTRNRLDVLLQAARILQDQGRDFLVQVVGDGPMRPVYHRQAKSLGVSERIEWLGLLDRERPRLYREATVFAAPCVLASFGVVLLEALASGTPVVCADNIGYRQVIRDGAPGRFVPPDDAAALAAGIAEQLDDAALRRDWGERGRAAAVERYSWPEIARRVEALYLDVLASKNGRPVDRPPVGLRYNLRRNPIELVRNVPAALRAGFPRQED